MAPNCPTPCGVAADLAHAAASCARTALACRDHQQADTASGPRQRAPRPRGCAPRESLSPRTDTSVPLLALSILPGDYGFDPLNLGADAANLEWFRNAELVHGRWAMLGAAGCLVPELLTTAGVADLPTWSEAGHAEYFTDAVTLGLVQAILFNWVEVLRFQDMRKPGSVHEGAC